MIDPPSSAWFEFYGTDGITIQPITSQRIYTEDLLGLKTLMYWNKIKFLEIDGDHL